VLLPITIGVVANPATTPIVVPKESRMPKVYLGRAAACRALPFALLVNLAACTAAEATDRARTGEPVEAEAARTATTRTGFPPVTAAAFADTTTARFADLPYGIPLEEAAARLEAKGYARSTADEDDTGDVVFRTTVDGYPSGVALMHAGGRYVKAFVTVATPDEACLPAYRTMRQTLITKYGAPDIDLRAFDSPYADGDGHEATAVRAGKAKIASSWTDARLALEVSKSLSLRLSYESVGWDAEAVTQRTARANANR
jgi:hypothetical protein